MPASKKNYSIYVAKATTGKWIGYWYEYRQGKRLKRQRVLGISPDSGRDMALSTHRKWVIRNVEGNTCPIDGYSLTSEKNGLAAVGRGATSLPTKGIRIANIGAVSELLVCADLINRGYSVFRSVSPSAPCDLIAYDDKTGKLIRVEVKTAKVKGGVLLSPLQRLVAGQFDVTAAVSRSGEICYQGNVPELSIELCVAL